MKIDDETIDQERRSFLMSGFIVVSFSLFAPRQLFAKVDSLGTQVIAPDLPGSLKSTPMLDAWIRIDAQGITVCSGKVELGTGVRTALWQIAADQLRVPFEQIRFVTADTGLTPNEGYTAGSHSMADSGTAIYNAAAQVRELLLEVAAKRLGVDVSSLSLRDGAIVTADGRKLAYAEAVEGANLHRQAKAKSPVENPSDFQFIGHSVKRVDIPAKVTGGATYVQDMRPEGVLHARVVRPPSRDAMLMNADVEHVQSLPGVVKVVRDGNYLAVLARNEWQSIVAMRELARTATWRPVRTFPTTGTVFSVLKTLQRRDYVDVTSSAVDESMESKAQQTMTRQYLQHGSIGPSCAVALYENDQLTVWTHSQGVYPLRTWIAGMLGLPTEKVRCIHVEGSGCYGHNGADDAAADAALLAMHVPGKPIRIQWMRDQEAMWEPFGPAMITELEASLDAGGRLANWNYALWSTPHNERISDPGRLMPTWFLSKPFVPGPSVPIPLPEGDADRNAIPLYRIPGLNVTMHFVTEMPFRTSAMRSLGAHLNVVSIESMIDELSGKANQDPVLFRLEHLDDPRARAVITLAADKFDWRNRRNGVPEPGRGVGFAFARYKNLMGYFAIAMEVRVDPDTKAIHFPYIVAAADCGQIVNPDGLRNQLEGGIVQTISWTLYEKVLFDENGVKSTDWATYPILRFNQLPDVVDVHLINQPGADFLGAAEIAQGPAAAAIVNALTHATGARISALPVTSYAPFA
jgi:nicotinate dehydrogenase subunit B